MLRRTFVAAAVAVAACAALPLISPIPSAAAATATSAEYDGDTIALNDGSWDGARACAVVTGGTTCFDTEAEMNDWLASQPDVSTASPSPRTAAAGGVSTMSLTCASSLRLYEHGGFGGRILYLASRGEWWNLKSFSFDNRTSSFAVGACSSYLAESTGGGGSWYPGGSAYASVPVMPSSWNDRISSVYLV